MDWEYEPSLDGYVAWVRGYRIRAERDEDPENPFETWDGCWPISVFTDNRIVDYDKTGSLSSPSILARFSDEALVHDQIAIAEILGTTIKELTSWSDEPVERYCHNADLLRDAFTDVAANLSDSSWLKAAAQLLDLLGIPCLLRSVRGYRQRDYAEVLVVATPEARKAFGVTEVKPEDLWAMVDLYAVWAWGDVYGYIVDKPVLDEDGEVEDWEQIDACWGYYGADFAASGLEEAALSAVPGEAAS